MTCCHCTTGQVSRQLVFREFYTGIGAKLSAIRTDARGGLRRTAAFGWCLAADCPGYQTDMRHASRLAPDKLSQIGHTRHSNPSWSGSGSGTVEATYKKIRQVPWRKALSKSGLIAVSDKRHRLSLEPAIPGLSRLVFRDAGCQSLPTGAVRDIAPLSRPPRLVPTTENRCFPWRKLGRLSVCSPTGGRNKSTAQPLGRVPPKPVFGSVRRYLSGVKVHVIVTAALVEEISHLLQPGFLKLRQLAVLD